MACERNRILKFINYIESLGIKVNIGKTKAWGNKGYFKVKNNSFRIDIAEKESEENILRTLVHEFIHYVHYKYDNKMNNLDFLLYENALEKYYDELSTLTVDSIPKKSISPLFKVRDEIKNTIETVTNNLRMTYPDIKLSQPCKDIEKKLKNSELKYLMKHDRVKLIKGFSSVVYSISDIDNYTNDKIISDYIKLKSAQRNLKRINSKINKLNKYYSSPAELIARAFETYITDSVSVKNKAPKLYKQFENYKYSCHIPEIKFMLECLQE